MTFAFTRHYVGIDVKDYNNDEISISAADEYFLVDSGKFSQKIRELTTDFDLITSTHNLEHCENPLETLHAMISRLKEGGHYSYLFLIRILHPIPAGMGV